MKEAMQFLIKKLGSNHHSSVVNFSTKAERKCRFLRMTPQGQKEVGKLVDDLPNGCYTNIAGGLRLALKVLNERTQTRGRVPAIMLMSDGDQDKRWEDATKVVVNNYPVFTFGFGHEEGYDHQVLNIIANNIKGGTFAVANVDNNALPNNLNIVFARCLGGLLTVIEQDFKLKITKDKPTITTNDMLKKSYPVKQDADSRTISFDHLYHGEKRSVLIDLHLPVAPNNNVGYEVLEITYSSECQGDSFDANPVTVNVYQTKSSVDAENPKVATEQNHVTIDKADNNSFSEAQNQLKQAQYLLGKVTLNDIIKILKSHVSQFSDVMKDAQAYKEKGKHIALAILTSHYCQCETITSDDPNAPSLFTTPGAQALVQQALDYVLNLSKPVEAFTNKVIDFPPPSTPESILTERVSDNITKAVSALQTVVVSLQEIQVALNSTKNA